MQPWKVLSGLRQSSATDTIRFAKFDCKRSQSPAELARENFPTAGHASSSATHTATDTATATATDTATDTATELHKLAAVESPLGAQTVLGDRHDPICEV